jgi:CheY-like chemotaxis protein
MSRVLYIEDDPVSIKLVEGVLAKRAPIELLAATDAAEGLRLARDAAPELIVLDLGLPDRPGLEVLEELRSDEATRAVPVIVLTADTARGQEARLLVAGALAYLTKPLDEELLLALVDEVMRERSARG